VKIWIDTDPAIGVPGCDVDDGLALIQAFHSPELEVHGVSAVFGNAPLDKAFPLAQEACRKFGPAGLEARSGAASADDLGKPSDAVIAMAEALTQRRLAVLALGPMTNVASLLQLHPQLAKQIDSIVMVAARRPGLEFYSTKTQKNPFPDFNFECDPEAMQIVLDSAVPLVFAPWEVSSHVWMTENDLDALAATGSSGEYIARLSRGWLEVWTEQLGAPGFNPFDTLAVAWLTHPELMECFTGPTWIEPAASADAKPQLLVGKESDRDPTRPETVYCHRPKPGFKPMLMERLAARA
jgi:inosine-uridine nucleoside N-ribohydrolase